MRKSSLIMRGAVFVVTCLLAINFCTAYPLNQTCSPPQSKGGTGYCGPSLCANAATTLPGCIFTQTRTFNYANLVSQTSTKKCTQSTDPRCKSAALKALMSGPGVKAAYCNDLFLVLQTDGTSGFPGYLQSILNPPASVANGVTCVTRYTNPTFLVSKIPLNPVLLSTSDPAVNNVNTNSFPSGASDSSTGYMSASPKFGGATYGLPTRGAVGISIGGQEIYPAFNNNGFLAPQKCEVDTCNEHVGGGGGQPHLHGDPFGSWCLYSAANYTTTTAHPIQIGWAFDGPSIYGRYLTTDSEGYSTALDPCGGHVHGSYGYHYHAQVLTSVTNGGVVPGQAQGVSYYASTTGPYQCLKGDISTITNFFGVSNLSFVSVLPDTTTHLCSGSSDYYVGAGIALPGVVPTPTATPTTSPTPAPSSSPTPAPSSSPTPAPSSSPTPAPSLSPTPAPSTVAPSAAPTKSPFTTKTPSAVPTTTSSPSLSASPTTRTPTAPTAPPTTSSPSLSASPTTRTPTAPTAPSVVPTTRSPSASMSESVSPTVMPSLPTALVPSVSPFSAPSLKPTPIFYFTQIVRGVSLTTQTKAMFIIGFQKGVGQLLGIPFTAVIVISITTITARRLTEDNYHHRPFLQSASSSVSVLYSVSVSGRTSKDLASNMTAQAATLSTSLVSSGFDGASAQEALESTPSPSPTSAPVSACGTTRSNMYLSFAVLCVAFLLSSW